MYHTRKPNPKRSWARISIWKKKKKRQLCNPRRSNRAKWLQLRSWESMFQSRLFVRVYLVLAALTICHAPLLSLCCHGDAGSVVGQTSLMVDGWLGISLGNSGLWVWVVWTWSFSLLGLDCYWWDCGWGCAFWCCAAVSFFQDEVMGEMARDFS